MRKSGALCALPMLVVLLVRPAPAFAQHYVQANLVANTGAAPVVDPNVRNAWGLVHSPTSPWWVSNNASGTSTLVNASTNPVTIPSVVVTIPPPTGQTGAGTPTGVVFNGSSTDFMLATGKQGARVLWEAMLQ